MINFIQIKKLKMKKLLFFLFLLFPLYLFSQVNFDGALQYTTKYNGGASIESGYLLNNKLYLGANVRITFFKPKYDRVSPIFFSGIVGYRVNAIQPFISLGSVSTGHEAYLENEGFKSFTYGGGISYFFSSTFKITLGAVRFKINKKDGIDENDVSIYLKSRNVINPFIRFTACFLGRNDKE